jgi:hypothetical protein
MAQGIKVFDPYKNELVDPDENNLSHRIAVAAQKAAMDNAPMTDLDATDPNLATGPVTTSGIQVVPTQNQTAPGTSMNADELAALGVDDEKKKGK